MGVGGEAGPGTEVEKGGRFECPDEGDLGTDVDHGAQQYGSDDRAREVSGRMGALPAHLEGSLESHEGEDDPASGDGGTSDLSRV